MTHILPVVVLLSGLVGIPLLHPGGVAVQGQDRQANPAPFAEYPPTNAFRSYIRSHLTPSLSHTSHAPLVFCATWFVDDSDTAAEKLRIWANGEVYSVQSIYDWSERASHSSTLSTWELDQVKRHIRSIRSPSTKPALADLLIVSYDLDGEWRTLLLDRNEIAAEIIQIYDLTRARSPVRMKLVPKDAP
jgi:hypothetical protein